MHTSKKVLWFEVNSTNLNR